MEHIKFHYRTQEDIQRELARVGVSFPLAPSTEILSTPLQFDNIILKNRMGIAPMEGADANLDGSPSALTTARYIRLAEGGAGVIWMEAVSVIESGRSSPHQLLLTPETSDAFARMIDQIKQAGIAATGTAPYIIMQANHSGRYSKPDGTPAPIIAYRHPIYEETRPADDSHIISDDDLMRLEDIFAENALLCRKVGFDAVDIKCCHGYLFAEMASAYTRPGSYGGSFENRFRLLKQTIAKAKSAETDTFQVTARIGIYDGFPYPYGFGTTEGHGLTPNFDEAIQLMKDLHYDLGLKFVNLTMGNPYQNTHVTRPYDVGNYIPPEHPFEGIARMISGTRAIKDAVPSLVVSTSAPSYLRQFSPNLAAGAILDGVCDHVLFGRMSFAHPGFPREIIETGTIAQNHTCVSCGKCGVLIRAGKATGCVVRMPDPYMKNLREIN